MLTHGGWLRQGIYDEDGNNDEDDESAVDNDEEDKLDAELEKLRTIKTSSFCIKKWSGHKTNRTGSYSPVLLLGQIPWMTPLALSAL